MHGAIRSSSLLSAEVMKLRRSALVLGLVVVAAGCASAGGSGSIAPVGSGPAVTPTDEPVPSDAASPTPTPVAGNGICDSANLYAEVISWDASAGHRTATVQLTNIGGATCKVRSLAKPELVDGNGTVLIQGATPTSTAVITLAPNDVVTTMVQDANYCGAAPVPPVSVAFVFPSGGGRVIADAVSPTDVDGLPPCNGSGGGQIEMQPFAP